MAKLLKLQGCGSYVSPRIDNTHVQRGQVIRVDDAVAEKLLEGKEFDSNDNEVHHFVEVPLDTEVNFDLAKGEKHVIEDAGEEAQEADTPTESKSVQKRVATQRKARSTATKT